MQTRDAPQASTYERLIETMSTLLLELNALQPLVAEDHIEAPTDRQTLRTGLHEIALNARDVLHTLRVSGEDFSATVLQDESLADALSRLLEETAERLALASRIALSGVDEQTRPNEHRLAEGAERLLYFIAREAMARVAFHRGARRLRLMLNYSVEEVQMSIEDDGLNQQSTETTDGPPALPFALNAGPNDQFEQESIWRELQQRLERLGGKLEIIALKDQGTRVQATVPYQPHLHSEPPKQMQGTSIQGQQVSLPRDEITVLVVDGQAVIRAALNRLLESYPGLHVIGQAADGIQAVSETLELGPNVVLMDSQLPEGQSLEALRQIKQLNINTRVLLISTQEREEYLYELLRAGADGYVLKDMAADDLAEAIRTVARGEILIQPQIASRLLSRVGKGRPYETLTAREQEVLRLLARGLRNKEIAARLFVSERTINFHLANIYQKLNVSGRTEALSRAMEQGLV